jgi:hypothetical protein
MQKNEPLLLDSWLKHHGTLFGYENLYIFDNGSTDIYCHALLKTYENEKSVKVNYNYSKAADFERKGDIILEKIKDLDDASDYDFYIPLDCDEFVSLRREEDFSFKRGDVEAHLQSFLGDSRVLEVQGCLYNVPKRENYYYGLGVKKTIFTRGTAGELDIGFHNGRSRLTPESVPIGLYYFHFHNKPFDMIREHARNKLFSRVKDFSRETLENYKGQGAHLVRYFLMEEKDYLTSFPVKSAKHIPSFREHLSSIGARIEY